MKCCLVILLTALAPSSAVAASLVQLQPKVPLWVELGAVPPAPKSTLERQRPDVVRLLVDTQDRVEPSGALTRYYHLAHQVLSAAGVQSESELSMDFDPAFETLRVHHVRVVRDGVARSVLKPRDLRVVQQEEELDRRILNGRISVMTFVDDVRVGDVIDYAYSVTGVNPAMRGHFDDAVSLADDEPVVVRRHRLLYSTARPTLQARSHAGAPEPRRGALAGYEELVWELHGAPALAADDDAPVWSSLGPWVQLSDFATWADVARWASAHYDAAARPTKEMRALVQRARGPGADSLSTTETLLAFVQDEVRYLGMELGPGALIPRPPRSVMERRFGDCKDKALLLSVLLREAGIDAAPALVSTRWGRQLDGLLPGAIVFDHVIVRARPEGRTVWLDATVDHQRGRLLERTPPALARALVLAGDTTSLELIPEARLAAPELHVAEEYRVGLPGQRTELQVVTTYRGEAADEMRRRVASAPRADLQEEFRQFYADHEGEMQLVAPLDVIDDSLANTLRTVESYSLEQFWRGAHHDFDPWTVSGQLIVPASRLRSTPLALDYPSHVHHSVVAHLPEPYEVEPHVASLASAALAVEARVRLEGRTLRLDYELRTLKDHVLPAELEEHTRTVEQARRLLSFRLDSGGAGAARQWPPAAGLLLVFFGTLAVAPVWRNAGLGSDARRLRRFRSLRVFAEGYAPETALRTRSLDHAVSRVRRLRCVCGKRFGRVAGEPSDVTFGGRRLWAYALTCGSCRTPATIYAIPGTSEL